MSENNSAPAIEVPQESVDEYSKPEQFCFGVEDFDGSPIVTICPIEYFESNGYQDDQYYDDIARVLEKHDFHAIMECSFASSDKTMTVEKARAKMIELGFKQLPTYDKYIEDTAQDFPIPFSGPESEMDIQDLIEDSSEDEVEEEGEEDLSGER